MKDKKKYSALKVSPGVVQPEVLNPNLKAQLKRSALPSQQKFVSGILAGDIGFLGRAISLVESTLPAHQLMAEAIINACLPHSGNSLRLGITGIPGVGKSTFIESFGLHLIAQNKKVAVLAIDPSSQKTGGSILGDKTRMEKLSQNPNAFIRPSPSAGSLGGVARKTRETIILCEAAGFDTIIVETVGVGQSETAVKSMVDFFLLLLLPGAGDELQGIKRGIMEMADGIAINKADGQNLQKAQAAASDVKRALRLYPTDKNQWQVPVQLCSATENTGITELWETIEMYVRHSTSKGFFAHNRGLQAAYWLQETISENLLSAFYQHPEIKAKYQDLLTDIKQNKVSPFTAARDLMALFLEHPTFKNT